VPKYQATRLFVMHFLHSCIEKYCIAQKVSPLHMNVAFAVSSSHFPERSLLEAKSFLFQAGFLPGLFFALRIPARLFLLQDTQTGLLNVSHA
jgi:hypothetical protein